MDSPFQIPQDFPLPPEPPAGLKVYQDERGEVLSHSRRSLPTVLFLTFWLVIWWGGIAVQLHQLFTQPAVMGQWIFCLVFIIPGVIVPFVIFGALFGAQELCFRFDGEITLVNRYGWFRFSKKSFSAREIQQLSVRQAPVFTKNHNRISHSSPTSSLDIALPGETLHATFPNDPEMALACYCGAKLRAAQRTF